MTFASGQQRLPPGTQVRLVTSDGEGNQKPIAGQPAADPLVTANPPTQAQPGQQPPPAKQEPSPEPKEEKKEAQVAGPKKPQQTQKPKPKQGAKPPSKDAVLSRARRLQRADRKKIWESMGWGSEDEPYSDEAFEQKMAVVQQEREQGMSEIERHQSKLQTTQQELDQLRAEKVQLQQQLTQARRQVQGMERQAKNEKIERDLREKAAAAGFKDTDYALYRLKKHVAEDLQEGQEPDVDTFFGDLKKDPSNRHLFREEEVSAGPQPVGNQQAPQQGNQQAQPQGAPQGQNNNNTHPGAPPKPASATPAGNQMPDALAMSDKDYRQYAREKYGYTPGMG